jgi:hypothetical protein
MRKSRYTEDLGLIFRRLLGAALCESGTNWVECCFCSVLGCDPKKHFSPRNREVDIPSPE